MIDKPVAYTIGDYVAVKVNGEPSKARIIGYELDTYLDPVDWVFYIMIMEYSYTIRVTQNQLILGVDIRTNGIWAKVLPSEKAKAK